MNPLYRFAYQTKRLAWKLLKPNTLGVKALLVKDDSILLVKHSYRRKWLLPGGGVRKNETFEQAIKREIKEELGGQINSLELLGVYSNFSEDKNDRIVVFVSRDFKIKGKLSGEIEKYAFIKMNELPKDIYPSNRRRIEEFSKNKKNCFGSW